MEWFSKGEVESEGNHFLINQEIVLFVLKGESQVLTLEVSSRSRIFFVLEDASLKSKIFIKPNSEVEISKIAYYNTKSVFELNLSNNSTVVVDSRITETKHRSEDLFYSNGTPNSSINLSQKAYLLSSSARISLMPSLSVSSKVKATHKASIIPLFSDNVLYLQSRGLSPHEARMLLLDGFFGVRKEIETLFNKKMELPSSLFSDS